MVLLREISAVICAVALMSCASHGKKEADGGPTGARLKPADSIGSESMKRMQEGKLSAMDQKVYGAAKPFGSGKTEFKTPAFNADKKFVSGKSDIKTNTFAQGGKETMDRERKFLSGKTDSRMIDKKFGTSENALGSKTSHDDAKMFTGNKDYSNKENYTAEKAVRESRKPLMVGDQPSIGEDQLQRLLNKQ